MAVLRLFAQAREIAREKTAQFDEPTVDLVLAAAQKSYGSDFSAVLAISNVWLNGCPASGDEPVTASDEVAVLPPVSGG